MHTPQEAPNPWLVLSGWPAWRGLRETLQSLEQVLRHMGALTDAASGAVDVADAIGTLLDAPATTYTTTQYRLRCTLRKAEPLMPADGTDLDTELLGWIDELARYVTDTPVLLDAAGSAAALGPALTADLPRLWQNRFAGVTRSLQQMLQATGGRKGKSPAWAPQTPPDLPAAPTRPSAAPPGPYIVPDQSGYAIVLPADTPPADLRAAWTELAAAIMRDHGADAMRLHLLLLSAAPAQSIPCDAIFAALGLGGRRTGLRHHHTSRCYEAIHQVRRIKLSVYRWGLAGGIITYERTAHDLWSLRVSEYGQARVFEHSGALATHGEDWTLLAGPSSWIHTMPAEVADHLASLSHSLLTEAEGARNLWSLAVGALIARDRAPGAEQPVTIPTAAVLQLAGIDSSTADEETHRQVWQGFWAALRLQRKWGWLLDRSDWHEAVRRHYAGRPQPEGVALGAESAWRLFLEGNSAFRLAPEG
jgi:hypothetical protein